jgi:hypothetical protein
MLFDVQQESHYMSIDKHQARLAMLSSAWRLGKDDI